MYFCVTRGGSLGEGGPSGGPPGGPSGWPPWVVSPWVVSPGGLPRGGGPLCECVKCHMLCTLSLHYCMCGVSATARRVGGVAAKGLSNRLTVDRCLADAI